MPYYGFDSMFRVITSVVPVLFFVVVGVVGFVLYKNVRVWNYNNKQPVVPAQATVVAKRADVTRHHHNTANGFANIHENTTYYLTYELENGQRMELRVPFEDYGVAVEGDRGTLTFQGSRFLSFARQNRQAC